MLDLVFAVINRLLSNVAEIACCTLKVLSRIVTVQKQKILILSLEPVLSKIFVVTQKSFIINIIAL